MEKKKSYKGYYITLAVFVLISCAIVLGGLFVKQAEKKEELEKDSAMTTRNYRTEIEVGMDNTYLVTEKISVSFNEQRHGIYRYIPYRGYTNDHKPVYASIKMLHSNEPYETDKENGNVIYQFGDEDTTKTGFDYNFSYQYTPKLDEQFNTAMYNLFPTGWKTEIPEGSSFQITFPKSFDHSQLQLYYGAYGETKDASNILELSWEGNVLSGTLKEPLKAFEGISFFATMPEGYFVNTKTTAGLKQLVMILSIAFGVVIIVLFFGFGIDKKIKPVTLYRAPDGIDSALAGYLVDGDIDTKDIMSLVLYLASKGYLNIKIEDKTTSFIKVRELDQYLPEYCKTIFDGIFDKAAIGEEVEVSSLQYKFAEKMEKAKVQLKDYVKKGEWGGVYTHSSIAFRIIGAVLAIAGVIIYAVSTAVTSTMSGFLIATTIGMVIYYVTGLILLCYAADKWYAMEREKSLTLVRLGVFAVLFGFISYGILFINDAAKHQVMDFRLPFLIMAAVTLIETACIVFLRKRTKKTAMSMNELIGFREYIEGQKLTERKQIIEANPDLFYDVLPYAYVFGLSDAWLNSLNGIEMERPDWIYDARTGHTAYHNFDMMLVFLLLNDRMRTATTTFTSIDTSSQTGAGGFGGGSSGGFSGGGFGGGGGGSW
ncbi:MAG: DUF2207 domain-containing protein [bacterium]|nr:DUF2207 domain-containing protein [bacterium]